MKPKSFSNGFTLIEMMIVMAIMGILLGIALPAMQEFLALSRQRSAASDVYTSFMVARSEAVKRSADVVISPSLSGWSGGWDVKVGATILATHDALSGLTLTASPGGASCADITYKPTGRISFSSNACSTTAWVAITSTAYPNRAARCVQVTPSGRPSLLVDSDGDATNGCN